MKAKNKLGLVFFPAFDWAISPSHPEREERLLYTKDQLYEEGIQDIEGISMFNPDIATDKDIQRVHFCVPNVKTRLTKSHYISAGGAIKAATELMEKRVDKAFALVRPPGHHAMRLVYGDRGFCIVNIEAVMIEHIREKYGPLRIAIVDSDCHHGDGTEDIYWNDKDTLFISFHQDGRTLYPGTGFSHDLGGPSAYGYNINVPLPPNTGDQGFLHVLNNLVMPILDDFKPDLIINSAGQDNHYSDPITRMNFTAKGYAKLNDILSPDIAVLEGGYSIEGALPYINLGIILAMAGLDYSNVREPDYDERDFRQAQDITRQIETTCKELMTIWENKEALARRIFQGKEEVIRDRQVYYDTDGIRDRQRQVFKICKNCQGLDSIESNSDRGHQVYAITIPRNACSSCIDEAYRAYKNAKLSYSHVYLQDKVNDLYHEKVR